MLWIAVTLPLLSLEAVKPLASLPDGLPAKPNRCEPCDREASQPPAAAGIAERRCYALADHAHVLMPDLDALRAGVQAGHSRSYALALAPGLKLLAADATRETQAFESIALALLTYTPKVSLADAHTLLLEVGSGLRLFGGLRMLLSRVQATVKEFGYTARIACAPTAWGAWLLAQARCARQGRRWHVIKETSLAHVLDGLSVSLLPVAPAHRDAFAHVGCATLADLRRLPRSGVVRRFGSAILDLLAQAYGTRADPREAFRAPASFHAQLELPSRVDHADALLFAARRLIVQLAGWLSAHHAALSGYTLLLEHELASRHAPKTSSLKVAWAIPSRDAEHLIWLLREKLNQTVLAAPVIELKLVADQIGEYAGKSDTLFPMPESDGDSIARLLERLSARLGPENVLQMSVQDDHRPERAMRVDAYEAQAFARKKRSPVKGRTKVKADKTWLTDELRHAAGAGSVDGEAQGQATEATPCTSESNDPEIALSSMGQPGDAQSLLDLPDSALPAQPRPLWMLDKPLRLMMRDQRPIYRRPLTMLTRTERIEAGWWDGNIVERDYYVAADDRGHMFWVYRERIKGEWYLQGLFG
jgi:protein ImuB